MVEIAMAAIAMANPRMPKPMLSPMSRKMTMIETVTILAMAIIGVVTTIGVTTIDIMKIRTTKNR